jgi:hypothetical protein
MTVVDIDGINGFDHTPYAVEFLPDEHGRVHEVTYPSGKK